MEIFGLFSVPNWLLILTVVLITYYKYLTWNYNLFEKMGIPVPGRRPWPVLGHLLDYQKQGAHICDLEWMKQFGKVFGIYEGTRPIMVISDIDMLKQILVKDFGNFCDRRVIDGLNGEAEKGLTVIKGEHWKHVRNVLTPTFSAGKLKRMMPLITRASDVLVKNMKNKVKESDVIDVKRAFGGYTMDVIASTAFGIEVDSQSNPDDPFVENASNMFKMNLTSVALLLILFFPFTKSFLGKLGFTLIPKSVGKFFRDLVIKLIKERQENKEEYKDFLQLMIEAKQAHEECGKSDSDKWDSSVKGLTIDEIVSQAILFFIGGYETTGSTLSLLAYNLALNPDKQQKLYEELVDKLESDEPTYDNLHELVYTEMCINETLRLFPPASRFDRVCLRDTEINGLKIPRNMVVYVPAYGIQHSPEIWENPETFIPERFSPEEKHNINPMHFMPFGYGPRNCIGIRLAYIQAKVAVADFYRNFQVSVCEKTQIPPKFQKLGAIMPDTVLLKVEPRNEI